MFGVISACQFLKPGEILERRAGHRIIVADQVVEDKESGACKVQVTYKGDIKQYSPEEISAMILSKMKAVAEAV